jgi:hypothetical protein
MTLLNLTEYLFPRLPSIYSVCHTLNPVLLSCLRKKSLKIERSNQKRKSKTDNTMAKWKKKNNDLQNTTQENKDRTTRTSLTRKWIQRHQSCYYYYKPGGESRGISRVTITTNPEVNPEAPVVLLLLQTRRLIQRHQSCYYYYKPGGESRGTSRVTIATNPEVNPEAPVVTITRG